MTWRRLLATALAVLTGVLSLSAGPAVARSTAVPGRMPTLVLWAWERPEDLRELPPDTGVAFLAQTITLDDGRVDVSPRRQPLRVSPATALMAVTRIQTASPRPPRLVDDRVAEVAERIARTASLANVGAIQIDFDATTSQRPLYRAIIRQVRERLRAGAPLSITALASWCAGDRWLDDLPVDEAVPMLFEMGPADAPYQSMALSPGSADRACRRALGLSLAEPRRVHASGRRVYVFDSKSWTATSIARAREIAR